MTERILGAVLAGGRSSRFGSDKAMALFECRPLLDHVVDALSDQVDMVAVCGRDLAGRLCLPDRPRPDLGPLGGLAAALRHALDHGYQAVVSAGCDAPMLPADLVLRLQCGGPVSYLRGSPITGLWPAALSPSLDRFIAGSPGRSVRAWADSAGAVAIDLPRPVANINTARDLRRLEMTR
ncbi:molybdenum cofactor guanylyltransferase [Brevundimonas sp.]|uniref:molybdenum cofactor guanylyltransferase n=1 Tax=Brevundimonas sp. TaxID=1871086 RepID=UPI002737ADE1|nr:molybdenum cofactor guanylyltransferase [Brevundimonas sp.]MDP3803232.1 molybdenum cofactor guanylyltransferase [Brevundimonas sp.]